jgi:hypothetical protein
MLCHPVHHHLGADAASAAPETCCAQKNATSEEKLTFMRLLHSKTIAATY